MVLIKSVHNILQSLFLKAFSVKKPCGIAAHIKGRSGRYAVHEVAVYPQAELSLQLSQAYELLTGSVFNRFYG